VTSSYWWPNYSLTSRGIFLSDPRCAPYHSSDKLWSISMATESVTTVLSDEWNGSPGFNHNGLRQLITRRNCGCEPPTQSELLRLLLAFGCWQRESSTHPSSGVCRREEQARTVHSSWTSAKVQPSPQFPSEWQSSSCAHSALASSVLCLGGYVAHTIKCSHSHAQWTPTRILRYFNCLFRAAEEQDVEWKVLFLENRRRKISSHLCILLLG
jgi:hypothetical protein